MALGAWSRAASGRASGVGQRRTPRRTRAVRLGARAAAGSEGDEEQPAPSAAPPRRAPGQLEPDKLARLRGEAQAPFRVLRKFIWGALAGSAGIGTGVALLQLLTKLAGAPNPPPVTNSLNNLAVNVPALALMIWLWLQEDKAQKKQLLRITREETLSALRMELGTGRCVDMGSVRGFARPVVFAGDEEHVRACLAAAEPFKEELKRRGVLAVPFVWGGPQVPVDTADKENARWLASPLYVQQWTDWLEGQMGAADVKPGSNVYIGLRMDGRVRASGKGAPPWERFSVELGATDGFFGGLLDGMDGSVGVDS